MSIAVDQTKLRRLCHEILDGEELDRPQAMTLLSIAQLAAGADHAERAAEHALLQSLAQWLSKESGIGEGEIDPIAPLPDHDARLSWFRALARDLRTRAARELAFAFAFLVFVADLELGPDEQATTEELQQALGVDDRRATDLVVLVTETVATPAPAA